MSQTSWKHVVVGLSLLGGTASAVFAQDPAVVNTAVDSTSHWNRGRPSGFGFAATLEQSLGLTPEQRDAVRGVLAEQRQESRALREKTDGKIRNILTPDQQKKFDALIAKQKSDRASRKAS